LIHLNPTAELKQDPLTTKFPDLSKGVANTPDPRMEDDNNTNIITPHQPHNPARKGENTERRGEGNTHPLTQQNTNPAPHKQT
jgi:hypothetical protein